MHITVVYNMDAVTTSFTSAHFSRESIYMPVQVHEYMQKHIFVPACLRSLSFCLTSFTAAKTL